MGAESLWLLAAIAVVSFALSFVGASVGLILGHLRLPLLIAYLGAPGAGAMTNLLISGFGALGGAARHLWEGRVSWVALALIGIPSAVGAVVAVLIFTQVSPLWSYLVIGVVLIASGVNLIRRKPPEGAGPQVSVVRRIILEVVIGLGMGALAAVTGLMLGSLRLPMMIRYLRMDPKEAIGTNMAVGCLTALVGSATALLAGPGRVDWLVMAVVVPPTLAGGYAGGWITGRFRKETVQKLAGWVILFSGVVLVGQWVDGIVRRPLGVPSVLVDESEFDGWFDFDKAEDDPLSDQ